MNRLRWKKMGRVFDPSEHPEWAGSHAQVPTVTVLEDRLRIYYADRTQQNKSFMTWIDVDREDPSRLLGARKGPIMDFGEPGMFDDDGMMPGDIARVDGQLWMYYTGWNRGVTIPYRNSIGLAISDDGGVTFRRKFAGPVLDRTAMEPLMAVTPFIIREGALWRMWYVGGTRWVDIDSRLEPIYVVRYAESADGIAWQRTGENCIIQGDEFEAQAHPSVLSVGGVYRMWFCYRSSRDFRDGAGSYRIGYAESADGYTWKRDDQAGGLDVSADGWDSKMTAYPYVVVADGRTMVFYNGNGFGRTGIGYAVLEE